MKVSELYNQVAQLGFEDSLENDDRFYQAANRALFQVAALRPEVRVFLLNHNPLENKILSDTRGPFNKKETLCFEAENVKAYYFEASGKGMCYIEKYNEANEKWEEQGSVTLDSSIKIFKTYYGLIEIDGNINTKGLIRLRFTGDYLYSVQNVAMYSDIYSNDKKDIPTAAEYTAYDISVLVDDFLALESPPIQDDSSFVKLGKHYDVESGKTLIISNDISGAFRILYRHKPTRLEAKLNADEDNTIIDVDDELANLLPTLIASYVWLEDEPEKAQYYYSLYKELAYNVERNTRKLAPVTITNNGW